ncbi:MAG: DnaK suppressor protein [Myxococcota bacterium]
MDEEQIQFFKKLLNERLEALLHEASENIGKLTDEREMLSDTLDIASMESSRDFTLRLQDRERRLVHKLRQALQRIDDDEYGVCIACGDDISGKRLMARPVATHCIDCKTEAEQQERRVF